MSFQPGVSVINNSVHHRVRMRPPRADHAHVLKNRDRRLAVERFGYRVPTQGVSSHKSLPIDIDEQDGLMARWAIHPDRRCLGSGAPIDALPQAARRPAIAPARRHLSLAFLEAIVRKGNQNLLWRPDPSVFIFGPRHPTLVAKIIERRSDPIHLWHAPSRVPVKGRDPESQSTGRRSTR